MECPYTDSEIQKIQLLVDELTKLLQVRRMVTHTESIMVMDEAVTHIIQDLDYIRYTG